MAFVLVPTVELLLGRTNLGSLLGFWTHLGLFQGLKFLPLKRALHFKTDSDAEEGAAEEREFAGI